uniref:DUF834 domain-containing protein n=1 Tax=Oryza glaberrima TaxID=4538 RepID=I1QQM0_ORYGL
MSASSFFPLFSPFLFSLSSLALGRPAPGRGGRGGPAAGDVAAVAAATTTREQVRGVGGGEGSKAELVGGIETVDTGGDGAVVTPGSCGGEGSIGLRLTGGGTADETGASGGGKGAVVRGDGFDGDDKVGEYSIQAFTILPLESGGGSAGFVGFLAWTSSPPPSCQENLRFLHGFGVLELDVGFQAGGCSGVDRDERDGLAGADGEVSDLGRRP